MARNDPLVQWEMDGNGLNGGLFQEAKAFMLTAAPSSLPTA